jgi:glycosyltransferase involved in cell wall biosynthesis
MLRGPLVSVVVPTYQRAATLEEALRSALTQTYERIEVLVEDDGSTDGSGEMVAKLGDPRVRYAWAANLGRPAAVRNRAIRRAQGPLVAFLDSDDVWEPEKLARQLEVLRAGPDLAAVSCNASWLPPRSHPMFRMKEDRQPSFEELLVHNVIVNSGAVVRREVLDEIGLFDEALPDLEDYDLWLRILRRRDRSIRVLRASLVRYRVSPDALSPKGPRELDRIRPMLEKHLDFRPEQVREALAARAQIARRAELQEALRAGTLRLGEWLLAPEVPLRRRLRLAAKALLLGRART